MGGSNGERRTMRRNIRELPGMAWFLVGGSFINRLKWADNGRARSAEELAAYLAEYRRRAGVWERLRFGVEQRLLDHAHRLGAEKTALYRLGRELYRWSTR